MWVSPVALGELVVGLVFGVAIEVEDGLDEVLAEHLRVVLQKQVHQAVLTQTATQHFQVCKRRGETLSAMTSDLRLCVLGLPGDGRHGVH